eukprot:m.8474 g.8474  ORF g.8474 m.8474 type:complete len:331 (-) comp2861_c0_seq1:374-1366(-)
MNTFALNLVVTRSFRSTLAGVTTLPTCFLLVSRARRHLLVLLLKLLLLLTLLVLALLLTRGIAGLLLHVCLAVFELHKLGKWLALFLPHLVCPLPVADEFGTNADNIAQERARGLALVCHRVLRVADQREVGPLEALLDLLDGKRVFRDILVGLSRILNTEQEGSLVVEEPSSALVEERTTVKNGDADRIVIKVEPIELEKLDKEDTKVALSGILAGMQLNEAQHKKQDGVGAKTTSVDFIELAIGQKLLDHHDKRPDAGVLGQMLLDALRFLGPIRHVEGDVDVNARPYVAKLDDWDPSLVDDLHVRRDFLGLELMGKRVQRGPSPLAD